MLFYLVGVVVFLCALHLLLNYNEKARMLRKIPGPEDSFILGNAPALMLSPVDLIKKGRELAKDSPGIYRLWMFPVGAVNIYTPDDIEIIVSGMKYHEKSGIYKLLAPWLGEGLLLSKGSKWQERRKILTPAFHFNILRQFSEIIEENGKRLVKRLQSEAGRPLDLVPLISEYTLNIICETAMGTQLIDGSSATRSYKDAIYGLGHVVYQRFIKVFYFVDFIFKLTPLSKVHDKYLNLVHSFTKSVIKERKEYINKYGMKFDEPAEDNEDSFVYKKKKKTAMLDLLISAQKENLIDEIGLQEEVDTFMFEGHDTTATGLTFCFMILANHKEVQDKIVAELNEIFGDSKRAVNMDDLPKMKYLERAVKESMRLYPPVPFISRSLHENVTLSNFEVPAGTFCHIHIYDLHRRPELFKNPDAFDPDRFLPENSVGRHPYAYIPFSAGPRNCIGQKFAMMEMKLAVAEVLREFELKPVTRPEDIEITADLVLRNNGPVEVTFVPRH